MLPVSALPAPAPGLSFPVAVAIVEDDEHVRSLLADYLGHQPEFTCVIVCDSVEALWPELELSLPPRLVLLDISLPGQSGLQALPELRRRLPQADVLIQTMHDDPDRIFQALRAGATGYVIKSSTPLPQYKQALLDLLHGGAALSPAVARKALAHFTPSARQQPDLLSARERDVLQGLEEGLTEKQVAHRLGLSAPTVHTYIRRLYDKLQVRSRGELIGRANRGEL